MRSAEKYTDSISSVAITGSSGLVGRALSRELLQQGCKVIPLTRASTSASGVGWDPLSASHDFPSDFSPECLIHLAGEPIIGRRWNKDVKKRIYESRVTATRNLVQCVLRMRKLPRMVLCASASGFYGDRGNEELTESSPQGEGFLANLVGEWEDACRPLSAAGIRTVQLRFGIILSREGGALKMMRLPFLLGIGGPLGDGRSVMSWISIHDVVGSILFCIQNKIEGPVNIVSPHPVTNSEFTTALASSLHRPAVLRVPAPLLRLVFGEVADETLLASVRVTPRILLSRGYNFLYPTLPETLKALK